MTMTNTAQEGDSRRRDDGARTFPDPVFLLAPARSCSTVAVALMSGHPDIYAFPELQLFEDTTVGGMLDRAARYRREQPPGWGESWLSGLVRTIAELDGTDQESESIRLARRWLDTHRNMSTSALWHRLLERVSPRIGLEKSPGTTNSDAALARCMATFPHARFIHLTRDPVATQASMQAHWQSMFADRSRLSLNARCASAWYLSHRRVADTLERLPSSRWLRVRAEHLVNDPVATLPRILRWLGVRADERTVATMRHTERWRYAGTGPSGRLYGGDPTFMNAPRLRPLPEPGPVRFPTAWGLSPEMERRMTALAARLGY